MEHNHQLAAILFADIAGYTALMQKDEDQALTLLHRFEKELEATVTAQHGRIVNFYGDGALCIFQNPIEAVCSAMALQTSFQQDPVVPVHMGIHSGTVVYEGNKAYGDSINLASRIESMSIPGTILLSKTIRDEIKNQPEFIFASLGTFEFKNVEEPLEVYALANDGFPVPNRETLQGKFKDDQFVKSIAVLPFANLSSDPEQEFFSDGLTEEIIADLSQIHSFQVTSHTSTLVFKNTKKDLRAIAKELGAQYILEGSVRKAGSKLRITAELIDARTDRHLWAEKYNGTMGDIFDLQEDVSRKIVAALNIKLTCQEEQKLSKRQITDLKAYEYYLKARQEMFLLTPDSLDKAMQLIDSAIKLFGENELLLATKGYVHFHHVNLGINPDCSHVDEAEKLVTRIFKINAVSIHGTFLHGLVCFKRARNQEAIHTFKKVLQLNPNHKDALFWYCMICISSGQGEKVRLYAEKLIDIDPLFPVNYAMMKLLEEFAGNSEKALYFSKIGYEMAPTNPFMMLVHASALVGAGDMAGAIQLMNTLTSIDSGIFSSFARFYQLALSGDKEKALEAANSNFEKEAWWDHEVSRLMAEVFTRLDEKEQTIKWMKHAMDLGFLNYPFVAKHNPVFKKFLTDRPFKLLLAEMKEKYEKFEV